MIGIAKRKNEIVNETINPFIPIPCAERIDVYAIEKETAPTEYARLSVGSIS